MWCLYITRIRTMWNKLLWKHLELNTLNIIENLEVKWYLCHHEQFLIFHNVLKAFCDRLRNAYASRIWLSCHITRRSIIFFETYFWRCLWTAYCLTISHYRTSAAYDFENRLLKNWNFLLMTVWLLSWSIILAKGEIANYEQCILLPRCCQSRLK